MDQQVNPPQVVTTEAPKEGSGLKKAVYTVLFLLIGMVAIWYIMKYYLNQLPGVSDLAPELTTGMTDLMFLLIIVVGMIFLLLLILLIAKRKPKEKFISQEVPK